MAGPLDGRVALVTGGSRGVGRGVAVALAKAGAKVYVTARSVEENSVEKRLPGSLASLEEEISAAGGSCTVLKCDHTQDDQTAAVVEQIRTAHGRLDILVNNAFAIPKPAKLFFHQPFYAQPVSFFDSVATVGLRNHYVATHYASDLLFAAEGLVVNVSSAGGQHYGFCTAYGTTKAALDRMSLDMARDLRPKNVACISLWPGAVKTERMVMGAELMGGIEKVEQGESPEFVGRVIAGLFADEARMAKSAKIWSTRRLAKEYGIVDVDGRELPLEIEPEQIHHIEDSAFLA